MKVKSLSRVAFPLTATGDGKDDLDVVMLLAASLVTQSVENSLVMQEASVQSLGREDPF